MLRNRAFGVGVGIWFAISWGTFVLFYAGGYHYGASDRYSVISAAPVALLMGIGAAALIAWLRRKPVLLAGAGAVIVMNWIVAMHFVPAPGREAAEARADIDFTRAAAKILPTGSLVISPDPCVWNLLGRNASQLSTVENMVRSEMRELVRQYPGGVYLHWDYWVNAEPRMAKIWRQLVLDTRAVVFFRQTAEADKFALFRLDTPYARDALGGRSVIERRGPDMDEVAAEALAGPAKPAVDGQAPPTPPPQRQTAP